MVDYSRYLKDEGIVRFISSATPYVPKVAGIYHIIVVPYSQIDRQTTGLTRSYLNAMKHAKIDVRDQPSTRLLPDDGREDIRISITPRTAHRIVEQTRKPPSLFRLGAMFPPVYVGQAKDLRRRFFEHDRGINSQVRAQLDDAGLNGLMSFFRWHHCDETDLDHIESVLIQAYLPIFNKQMR